MSKIYSLKINNFRGIQNFEQVFGDTNLVCILGRGDSGKTTILEAISMVLSPSWNLTFLDSDFYGCDIEIPIIIEATLLDVPTELMTENKFGLYKRGLDAATGAISDELHEGDKDLLTIRLTVEKDLEPKWEVINNRQNQANIEIRASDRAKLNTFYVSDYIDRHFSWSKGTPLYSLLRASEPAVGATNVIIDALREAKTKIDEESFEHLSDVTNKVIQMAAEFGIDISGTSTTIDLKDLTIKDGRISLHDGNIPFRLKGKGSKRLISIAVQMELAKTGGIILIDEIEQGLEPDRAKHLANRLKTSGAGQVFMTTHSRDVLVELDAGNLYKLKKGNPELFVFDDSLQGAIRKNPEALFADNILVGEGLTEVGITRGINQYRIAKGLRNMSSLGVVPADGTGSGMIDYVKGFLKAGYGVALFCDSDVETVNDKKEELRSSGCEIIDCEDKKSIEHQVFDDLPWPGIKSLLEYHISSNDIESVKQSVQSKFGGASFPENWLDTDSVEMRSAFTTVAGKNGWFKNIDHGEYIAEICSIHFESMDPSKRTRMIFQNLSNWMENA